MNPAGLLFLFLVVGGIAGLVFVTAPSIGYMFGAAETPEDASLIGVIATAIVLWISTGFFVFLTLGGSLATIYFTLED